MRSKKKITAEAFDQLVDSGKAISEFVDYSKGFHPNLKTKRISADLPMWLIETLDREAAKLAVARLAVLKTVMAEWAEKKNKVV
jgi:hypothetical protein